MINMGNNIDLVNETSREIEEYIPKMIDGIDIFIKKIMSGEEAEANSVLSNIFEGLEWIIQAVKLTNRFIQGDMEEENLLSKLPLLIDAYENKDMILVSDILDYEIKPILEKWIHQIH